MKFINILFIISLSILGYSQNQEIVFRNLDINNGLSQNTVISIIQDNNGFIWLGTYDGINIFDGKEITRFSCKSEQSQSINSRSIYSLCKDNNNLIYISTEGSGVIIFNPITETISTITADSSKCSIPSNNVTELFLSSDNLIWITTRSGLAIYNPKNKTTQKF